MKKFLVALLLLIVAAVPAFAGRCSETGDCGTGTSSGGGGGYTQRESGLWVPNYGEYVQQSAVPSASGTAQEFGQDVAKGIAKDSIKYVLAATAAAAGRTLASMWHGLTEEERAALPMMPIK